MTVIPLSKKNSEVRIYFPIESSSLGGEGLNVGTQGATLLWKAHEEGVWTMMVQSQSCNGPLRESSPEGRGSFSISIRLPCKTRESRKAFRKRAQLRCHSGGVIDQGAAVVVEWLECRGMSSE